MSKKRIFLFSVAAGMITSPLFYLLCVETKWDFMVFFIGPGIFANMLVFGIHGSMRPHPLVSGLLMFGANALYHAIVFFVLGFVSKLFQRSTKKVNAA